MTARRPAVIFVAVLLAGCSYDWDGFDPRLSSGSGGNAAAGGDGGTPTTQTSSSVGGSGGAVGAGGFGSGGSAGGAASGGTGGVGGDGGTGGSGGTPLSGLLAAWSLDEGSGTVVNDVSGNGYHGSIASPEWVVGVNGSALRIDDPLDTVVIPVDAAFDRVPGASYTITAWIAHRGMDTTDHSGMVAVSFGPNPQNMYGLEPRFDAAEWKLSFWDGSIHAAQTALSLPDGQWRHIAAVVDGGTSVRLFADGAQISQGTVIDSQQGAIELTLGAYFDTFVTGDLDQVRFYSRALTAAEVVVDMQQ